MKRGPIEVGSAIPALQGEGGDRINVRAVRSVMSPRMNRKPPHSSADTASRTSVRLRSCHVARLSRPTPRCPSRSRFEPMNPGTPVASHARLARALPSPCRMRSSTSDHVAKAIRKASRPCASGSKDPPQCNGHTPGPDGSCGNPPSYRRLAATIAAVISLWFCWQRGISKLEHKIQRPHK